jgi:GLPGLI family protein
MRKLIFTFLIAFHFSVALNAQKDTAFALVRYAFTHIDDTTQPDKPVKAEMALYLGKQLSLYTNYAKMLRLANGGTTQTTESVNGGMVIVSGGMAGGPAPAPLNPLLAMSGNYYKDIIESKAFSVEAAGVKVFSVEDKLPVIDWSVSTETRDIMGMPCQKATGSFKGRVYEAWFCNQLPFSNGPWKLGGLPGLILEASDTQKEVMFKLVSYESALTLSTVIEIPAEALKTNPKEMRQYRDALQKNRDAAIGANGGFQGNMRLSAITISGTDGKPVKLKVLNNPIEKEK